MKKVKSYKSFSVKYNTFALALKYFCVVNHKNKPHDDTSV